MQRRPATPPPRRRVLGGGGRRPPSAGRPVGRPLADPRKRLRLTLTAVCCALLLVALRLVQLQGFESHKYAAMAEQQRLRSVTLSAPRGEITDVHGNPLAVTLDARDLYADPKEVVDATAAAAKIAPILGEDPATVAAELTQHTTFVYLARAVTPKVANRVLALGLAGVADLPSSRRVYPDGTLAANVLGFVGTDGTGLDGLEYLDNKELTGTNGVRTFEVGLDGNPIPGGQHRDVPAKPGTGLRLTLDSDIQWEAQQAIAAQVKATKAASGTVIVLNPHTGALLAVASAPTFNPNDPAASPPASFADPAVTDPYEPGSVGKVITMAAGLQAGLITPTTPFVIPPTYSVGGSVFHDAENHGTEHLTTSGILAQSSNIGAIQIAEKVGAQGMYSMLRNFGFGVPTGVGLPGESGGILTPPSQWWATTLPTISFGQGISVTAMQVATVYATIANGGVRVQPHILAGTVGPAGHFHAAPPPAERRVVSPQVAQALRLMLQGVTTQEGTAPAAQIAGYQVAGKTGTANRPDGHGSYSGYTATFVGFAPAADPQLVVEVVLQKPQTSIYGGTVAAPVFHDVMSYALKSLEIPPTDAPAPTLQLTW